MQIMLKQVMLLYTRKYFRYLKYYKGKSGIVCLLQILEPMILGHMQYLLLSFSFFKNLCEAAKVVSASLSRSIY